MTSKGNSITLTFNGVDFCLTPVSNNGGGGITIKPNKDGAFTAIQMRSFTGSLSVSLATKPNADGFVSPMGPTTPPMSSATVEDEENSPVDDVQEVKRSKTVMPIKGQPQLPFEKKKRVLSDISTMPDVPTKSLSRSQVSFQPQYYMHMYL